MRLARWCYEERGYVVGLWIFALVFFGVVGNAIGSDFSGDPEPPPGETAEGIDILNEHFPNPPAGATGSIVIRSESGFDDPALRADLEPLFALATTLDDIAVISPFDPAAAGQIATEGPEAGKIAYARVEVGDDITFATSGALGDDLEDLATEIEEANPGLQIEIGGEVLAGFKPPESETIGLAFAVVILLVSFGSVLAMGLPIAVALGGVGLGLVFTGMLSNFIAMPDFATIIGAMIGLGVGIDYALFIVTRYREGLHEGWDPKTSTMAAMDTAGRAVMFAGVTVVVSLLGLLLIGLEFVAGMGLGAAITVTTTMLTSATLLPALLGFARLRVEVTRIRGLVAAGFVAVAMLGTGLHVPGAPLGFLLAVATILVGSRIPVPGLRRITPIVPVLRRTVPHRTPKPVEETGWYKWSHLIQDRPWRFAIAGTTILVILSLPLLGLRLGFADEGNYPEDSTTRQAYDLLSEGFGPGFNGPFFAVAEVDGADQVAAVSTVASAIAADPGIARVDPPVPNSFFGGEPTAVLLRIIPATAPQDEATENTVNRLRDEVIPAAQEGTGLDVKVTGFIPGGIDFSSYLGERSLLFFAVVLLASFLLLMAVFRSLLVPIKAVIMNMLSISGAYGVVVAVFQWGWLSDITQVTPGPIEPFIPMMMFAIVFGLSMDYEVFLLSRIKEEYERTGEPRNSVADGLASTARVISAAAAIMVVVFGSFLLEDQRVTKVMGTGLGVAILLDATLVRMLLVPATMELLGKRNWWIPSFLDRWLPQLNVEGAPDHDELVAEALAQNMPEAEVPELAELPELEPAAEREPVGV